MIADRCKGPCLAINLQTKIAFIHQPQTKLHAELQTPTSTLRLIVQSSSCQYAWLECCA